MRISSPQPRSSRSGFGLTTGRRPLPGIVAPALMVMVLAALVMVLAGCNGGSSRGGSKGSLPEISADELTQRLEAGDELILLDVRTPGEFAHGRIEGAINIPHYEVSRRLVELETYRGVPIVVYCELDVRADDVVRNLRGRGFENAVIYRGGMSEWRKLSD